MSDDVAAARMEAAADLLAEGYEIEDLTLLLMVDRAMRRLVDRAVRFHLTADNVDRPDADKYGTFPDGRPKYAPEWFMAQDIRTFVHEGLLGTLKPILGCDSTDDEGRRCTGHLLHMGGHWDGNGAHWDDSAAGDR